MKFLNIFRKVQLSDGQPSSIDRALASKKSNELADEIKEVCRAKGLSYVETNKALYLADTELYMETINTNLHQN